MDKRKKIILIVSIIAVLTVGTIIFFLTREKKDDVLQTELEQKALTTKGSRNVTLGKVRFPSESGYYIWEVTNRLSLDTLKSLSSDLGFKLEDSVSGHFYRWVKGDDAIFYEIDANTVMFMGEGLLVVDNMEAEPEEIISQVVKKYFGKEWRYKVTSVERRSKGETVYFLNRYLDSKNIIEIANVDSDTDYIALKDGNIVYAKFLLSEFENTQKKTELIEYRELDQEINKKSYPKDFYAKIGSLDSEIQKEMRYDRDLYEYFYNNIGKCEAVEVSVVYLYKHMSQGVLTPVYKVTAQCYSMYKKEEILVPSVFYVNAIDLKYLKTETKK